MRKFYILLCFCTFVKAETLQEKAGWSTFVQKICAINVDKIDSWLPKSFSAQFSVNLLNFDLNNSTQLVQKAILFFLTLFFLFPMLNWQSTSQLVNWSELCYRSLANIIGNFFLSIKDGGLVFVCEQIILKTLFEIAFENKIGFYYWEACPRNMIFNNIYSEFNTFYWYWSRYES